MPLRQGEDYAKVWCPRSGEMDGVLVGKGCEASGIANPI